jgi:Fe2+ or Zn2+ uptake regulation protein
LHVSCADRLTRDLRAAGYRVTPQRLIILESVAHAHNHTSAQQVFRQARRRLPGLNPATVYRTLQTLHTAGIVDLYANGGEALRFSLRDPEHPHAHMVCRSCGRQLELDPDLLGTFARGVKRQTGFEIDTHHLTLGGACPRCAAV